MKIAIVFGIVDRVVRAAFNNEAAGLKEGLPIFDGEGFDASNSGVGHGKNNPLMAGDASATRKRQKIIVTGCIASRIKSNGANGSCLWCVGGVVVLEHLDIGAEFKFEFVEIWWWDPGDKGRGAEGVGDAVDAGKTVEVADDIVDHVLNKEARQTAERETVDAGTQPLFHSANGAFDFAYMTVGGDKVNHDGKKIIANASELMIGMDVANAKATRSIGVDGGPEPGEYGRTLAVGSGKNGPETNITRDGVKKRYLLDVKKIGTQSDIKMVVGNGGRNGNGLKLGNMWRSGALCSGSFEKRNIGAVDDEGASSILRGDRAVAKVLPF
jgi:hypothetical protein